MNVVGELSIDDLWRAHADELLRFATVLAGPHDASDIVADAMLRAASAASTPTVANHRAYLFRAVANRAYDEHRSRKRRWRRDLSAVGPATIDQPDDHSDVRRAVARLSVQQRAVVYLAYWEDLPERAIAELLELSQAPSIARSNAPATPSAGPCDERPAPRPGDPFGPRRSRRCSPAS